MAELLAALGMLVLLAASAVGIGLWAASGFVGRRTEVNRRPPGARRPPPPPAPPLARPARIAHDTGAGPASLKQNHSDNRR